MFPIYVNLFQSPTFYSQYPFMFQYNNSIPPIYHQTQNQQLIESLQKQVKPEDGQFQNEDEFSKKSEKAIKKKIRKMDNEYRVKDQNAQRNIISNIAHHLMSYIRKEGITKEVVEKIINTHSIDTTFEQFFATFRKIKLRNYVRKITLEDLWENGPNAKFTKIFRILSYDFLKQKCFCSIVFSRKIKKSLKLQHLPKIRELANFLRKNKHK